MSRAWLAWRPGGFARASATLLAWMLLRAAAQAATVVLMARFLGAAAYGEFVAALALASFLTPVAGLGLHLVILRDGAREPARLPALLGGALAACRLSVPGSWIGAMALALWMLPAGTPLLPLAAMLGAEVAATSLTELLARVEQATHSAARFGAIMTGLTLSRMLVALAWMSLAAPDVGGWMLAYAAASAVYAAALLAYMVRRWRPVRGSAAPGAMARAGVPFTTGAVAVRLQAEFNKPLLAGLGWALASNLSLAQRAVELAALPLQVMQDALSSRAFASADPHRRLRVTGAALLVLAVLGGGALALGAPWLPRLLGPGYAQTAHLVELMAWLPAVQVLRSLGTTRIMIDGRSAALTYVSLGSAVAGVVLASALIARFSLGGAVAAIYATEATTLALQFAVRWRR